MSGFSHEWLSLREGADAAARSRSLVSFVAPAVRLGRLLDLGGGTGSNIRYLAPQLSMPQRWTIVDDDDALVAAAPEGVRRHVADLNDAVEDEALFDGCDLVTASALLDLVADRWLERLVSRCRAAGSAVLFALSYDGRVSCDPAESDDDEVRRLFDEHQTMDKGLGPALGPAAGARAVERLARAGYDVRHERSDWRLGARDAELQRQLVNGWARAAADVAPGRAEAIAAWRRRRVAHIDSGRSRIVVGHVDVAGVLRA